MSKLRIAVLATLMVAAAAAPAAAQSGFTSFKCSMMFTQYFSPGFTLTPGSGPQGSTGSSPMSCSGTVQGHAITGPGSVTNLGAYHDSTCLLDHADGDVTLILPTDGGTLTLPWHFNVTRVAVLLSVEIQGPGVRGEGSAVVVPTKGDCVLNPITEALVLMNITFKSDPPATTCDLDLGVVQVMCKTRG